MLTIIISACLISDPNSCKDYRLPVEGGMDAVQCSLMAPPYLATWMESHPELAIKKWKCQPAAMEDDT